MPANNQIPTTQDVINAINNGTLMYAPGKSGLGGDMNFCWRWQDFKYWINNNGVVSPNDVKLITWGEILANKITNSFSLATTPSTAHADIYGDFYLAINITGIIGVTTINFFASVYNTYLYDAGINFGSPGTVTVTNQPTPGDMYFTLTVPAGTTSTAVVINGNLNGNYSSDLEIQASSGSIGDEVTVTVYAEGAG